MTEMFQLEPSTEGALEIDYQYSLATMATGVFNATQEMSQAVGSTHYPVNTIKDDNAITVTSGVTTAIAFSSLQNSIESNHSTTSKSTTAKPHSFGGGQTSKQYRPGFEDTKYSDGDDDDRKLAAANPKQQQT